LDRALHRDLEGYKSEEVYSQLVQKLRVAEGKICSLWGAGYSPDFSRYSEEDLTRVLEDAKPPGKDKEQVLAMLQSDRNAAIQEIQKLRRQKELNDARRANEGAKNHIILEGIFMTKAVRDLALKVSTSLSHAWVDVHVGEDAASAGAPGNFHQDFIRDSERATALMAELEDKMRTDLLPASIEPSPRSSPQS
jgi:hypothetical protein